MNLNFLKRSMQVALFLLFGFTACDKEEWIELQLTDTTCDFDGESFGVLTNEEGIVTRFDSNSYLIIVNDVLGHSRLPLTPCNISHKELRDQHKVILSGEVFEWDSSNDTIPASYAAAPIVLTHIKIFK